jgi:peptide/nickel transport system substrate-binding protein
MKAIITTVLTILMLISRGSQAADLRIALSSYPTAMDPQFHNLGANISIAQNMFDTLVRMDTDGRLIPGLADSWTMVDDNTWEFHLRPGVTFHSGAKLTAQDVIFSLARPATLLNSPAGFGIYTKSIAGSIAIGDITFRLTTNGPYPLMLSDLSTIFILRKAAAESLSIEDFAHGKGMDGTGAYRFVSFQHDDRVEMTRNDQAWSGAPAWNYVTVRFIPNNAARLAALLSGDVDAIEGVPASDITSVRQNPGFVFAQKTSARLVYFYVDSGREDTPQVSAKDGGKLARNPLADERVRRALSLAINRAAIAESLMAGLGYPTGNIVPETFFGYDASLPVPPFDPEAARKLLVEAGYPDGFSMIINGPNDRLVNDAQIVQAVAQMLTRIGITTKVETSPMSTYAPRGARGEFSFGLIGFASATGESSAFLRAIIACQDPKAGGGLYNWSHYCNHQVDADLIQALRTVDDRARLRLLREATHIAITDEAIIPLHFQASTWAARRGIAIEPRTDERTLAASFRPVP